ncbi:MAG TPA: MFS transporter [Thermomicrobiales bacterium]|nr:MFS transporter [Thermomicrobiales bacterium]
MAEVSATGLVEGEGAVVGAPEGAEVAAEPAALSLRTMLLYSVASAGKNMVDAFSNAALPLYLEPYGLPGWLVGLLAQERSGIGGLVQPAIGALSDRTRTRFGRRRPFFLVGASLTALALVFLAFHPPLVPMLAVVAILSFLLAVAADPYLALMADMTPERQRGRLGSYMGICAMAGQVVLLLLASKFWQAHERVVIFAAAGGLLVCFGVTFAGVREPAVPARRPAPARPRFTPGRYLRDVLREREVAKYSLALTFFWLGGGAAAPFLTRFGVHELGLSDGTAFFLVMLIVLCTAVFAYPAGYLGDRYGKKVVQSAGLLFYGVAILVSSQVRTLEQILPAIVFVGLGNTIPTVLAMPMLADLIPKARAGEFTGLGSMLWSLSQPLGALIGGALADASGGYRLTFVFAGLMMFVSFALLQTVRTGSRAHPQASPRQSDSRAVG